MDSLPVLVWYSAAKAAVYGASGAAALVYYSRRACRERMPRLFGWFVASLFLVASGEALVWAAHWLPGLWRAAVAGCAAAVGGLALSVVTVTAMSVAYRRTAADLRERAFTDPLTGLANRRAFFEALEARLARARQARGDRFAVAILDLDNMKRINDTLGHLAGDEALRLAAPVFSRGAVLY